MNRENMVKITKIHERSIRIQEKRDRKLRALNSQHQSQNLNEDEYARGFELDPRSDLSLSPIRHPLFRRKVTN